MKIDIKPNCKTDHAMHKLKFKKAVVRNMTYSDVVNAALRFSCGAFYKFNGVLLVPSDAPLLQEALNRRINVKRGDK